MVQWPSITVYQDTLCLGMEPGTVGKMERGLHSNISANVSTCTCTYTHMCKVGGEGGKMEESEFIDIHVHVHV